jgi:hypothetical protein
MSSSSGKSSLDATDGASAWMSLLLLLLLLSDSVAVALA